MFGFLWVYSDAGAPWVKYPVIIGQFLGANGVGNGGSCVLRVDPRVQQTALPGEGDRRDIRFLGHGW
ncbi:hypothetical protein ES703_83910 [subsurface metagenome]